MAKRLTNIESSRVKSSRIDWSQENEKQLHRTGPAIARLLWQTTFLFYFPSSALSCTLFRLLNLSLIFILFAIAVWQVFPHR